jgi:hypothetical protein
MCKRDRSPSRRPLGRCCIPVEPPEVNGLLPGRGPGCGRWDPCRCPCPMPVLSPPNGLFPGRGPDGRGAGPGFGPPVPAVPPGLPAGESGLLLGRSLPAGGPGRAAGPGLGAGPGRGPGLGAADRSAVSGGVVESTGVGADCSARGAGSPVVCGSAGGLATGVGAASAGVGADGALGAFFALVGASGLPADLFPAAGWLANDSLSLRTTGASTVEDADLTYSPRALSLPRTSLLETPSSLASSCTRTFATALLLGPGARLGPASWCACSSLRAHRTLVRVTSCLLLPGQSVGPALAGPTGRGPVRGLAFRATGAPH